jgi:hypothetical protein
VRPPNGEFAPGTPTWKVPRSLDGGVSFQWGVEPALSEMQTAMAAAIGQADEARAAFEKLKQAYKPRSTTSCCCPGSRHHIQFMFDRGCPPAYVCSRDAVSEDGLCKSCAENCLRQAESDDYRQGYLQALSENVRRHRTELPPIDYREL